MAFIDLFSDKADLYASARPAYPDAIFDFVARHAPADQCAWDCASGSGQAAHGLARRFARVEATDASAAQIAHAIPCSGVNFSVQPAEQTGFADASFDAVCVAQALHWFKHAEFFAEVSRVLRPGGIFAAWGYDWSRVDPAFDEEMQCSVLDVIAQRWAPQNGLLWNGYRDLALPFAGIATPEIQMQVTWTFPQFLAYVHTWSAIRQAIAEEGRAFFDQAEERLAPKWGEPMTARVVTFRLHLIAARRPGATLGGVGTTG